MKNIFIITTINISGENSAGFSRIMKYSKALVSEGNRVYLISLNDCWRGPWHKTEICENIFILNADIQGINLLFAFIKSIQFCIRLNNIVQKDFSENRPILLLYPSGIATFDYACLLFFKSVFKYKIYYEVNELRRASLENRVFSRSIWGIFERIKYIKDFIDYRIIERLTRYYDGLITISHNLREYFNKYNSNILIIPILSDYPDKIVINEFPFQYGDCFQIAFAGSISLKKEGFDDLLFALSILNKSYSSFELHLYGNINLNEKEQILKELPAKYNIQEKIIYHGLVSEKVLCTYLRDYDLLILPRPLNLQTMYGFSNKLSNYIISSVPVLLTDVSDNGKYIKDGVNGYIIPPGNPMIMANKILLIIKTETSVKKKIVENAIQTSIECFFYKNYSKLLDNFIK